MPPSKILPPEEFQSALVNGHFRKAERAIKAGQPLVDGPRFPLMVCAIQANSKHVEQHLDMVKRLLDGGANPNAVLPSSFAGTSLHAWVNAISMAELSIEHRLDFLDALLEYGADPWLVAPYARQKEAAAPLVVALLSTPLLFKAFLQRIPDEAVDTPVKYGMTLLHFAAMNTLDPRDAQEKMLPLLKKGARLDLCDGRNRTPLDLAIQGRREHAIAMLMEHQSAANKKKLECALEQALPSQDSASVARHRM